MAQYSGFFNAIYSDGEYDRKYNADDYTDNLAVVISNGVLRSNNDDLAVTASGLTITVAEGRAWIKGHYYYNDAPYTFAAASAPITGARYDRVFLRLDTSIAARSISLIYRQGIASSSPAKPSPIRAGSVYELVLADIYIEANTSSVTVTDTRSDKDLCGWVYSTSGDDSFFISLDNTFNEWFLSAKDTLASVTLFKRYRWRTVLDLASSQVQFSIPQYNAETSFIEVFINGILVNQGTDYTLSGNILTFSDTLVADTEIVVNAYKSIDGTGIQSVSDEITELQNKVAAIDTSANYDYVCTGLNDNLSISQIAQALYSGSYIADDVTSAANAFLTMLGGNTFLAELSSDAHLTINVIGNMGVSSPVSGSGTSSSRYKWFTLGVDATGDKRITFDFAKCNRFTVNCSGNTKNIIFYGTDMSLKNVDISAKCNAAGCEIEMFAGQYNSGNISVENSRLKITTTANAKISENGTFINCEVYCSSSDANAFCFAPETDSLIRLIGGTYRAYTASPISENISAIFYTYSTATNGCVMAYNINCPIVPVSAFYQKYLAVTYAGKTYINGVITTLNSLGDYNEIVGKVSYNKIS